MNGISRDERELLALNEVTGRIIGCALAVSNTPGVGFLEKVYENALAIEMRDRGLSAVAQRGVAVRYKDNIVGEYIADFIVEDRVIVELKVVSALNDIHVAQCMNYLRATGIRLCLLINFGRPRIEIRRLAAAV